MKLLKSLACTFLLSSSVFCASFNNDTVPSFNGAVGYDGATNTGLSRLVSAMPRVEDGLATTGSHLPATTEEVEEVIDGEEGAVAATEISTVGGFSTELLKISTLDAAFATLLKASSVLDETSQVTMRGILGTLNHNIVAGMSALTDSVLTTTDDSKTAWLETVISSVYGILNTMELGSGLDTWQISTTGELTRGSADGTVLEGVDTEVGAGDSTILTLTPVQAGVFALLQQVPDQAEQLRSLLYTDSGTAQRDLLDSMESVLTSDDATAQLFYSLYDTLTGSTDLAASVVHMPSLAVGAAGSVVDELV